MSKSDIEILESLHPNVQRAIKKKWKDEKIENFRPVQEVAIPFIAQGKSCLVISPTAGGKTEAAILPVLSRIYDSASQNIGVHAIYIAPLKALLNDLAERIEDWLLLMEDISLFKWHGDVSAFHKNKQRKKPASILLTTPESLDVMLASVTIDKTEYFKHVASVIIDEAHYFAADSRGSQLASILERVQMYALEPIQRIGLSATIGNPKTVSIWLKGSVDNCEILTSKGIERKIDLEDIFINEENDNYQEELQAKLKAFTLYGKTVIFGNSKKDVEMTARLLEDNVPEVMVHHGSISKYLREGSEEWMRNNKKDAVISATSTLELGIDIGDLNRVIQKGHLPSVNSYLQRIGRAGRRDGKAHIILLSSTFEQFVLNMAMATLGAEGYCEPLHPSRRRYDILLQQLFMEILGNYGITADIFFEKTKKAYPFSEINRTDFNKLLIKWMELNLIITNGHLLLIGPAIEHRYGSRNFMELYSVFDTNEFFTVFNNEEEIGYLESWFAFTLKSGESVFQLAGRKWFVLEIISDLKRIYVKPAKDALPPVWRGGSYLQITYSVARRFQDILEGSFDITDKVKPEAAETIKLYRQSGGHSVVREGEIDFIKNGTDLWIETYAGTMINSVLSFVLTDAFPKIDATHSFIRLEVTSGEQTVQQITNTIYEFLGNLSSMSYEEWIHFLFRHLDNYQYSRFSEYIPKNYSVHHAAESYYLLDEVQMYAGRLKRI